MVITVVSSESQEDRIWRTRE